MGEFKLAGQSVTTVACYCCGTVFAMDSELYWRRRDDGNMFWCPNGHQQHFTESELQRAQKRAENLAKRLEWAEQGERNAIARADATERRRRSIQGHATRLRKRIASGQCPCCKERFAELEQHIAEKHPRYKPKSE